MDPAAQPAKDEVIEFSYNHDFVLVSNIGTVRKFHVDKKKLALESKVFEGILDDREVKEQTINFDSDIVKLALEIIYAPNYTTYAPDIEDYFSLLQLAKYYNIPKITNYCETRLVKTFMFLPLDTAFAYADQFGLGNLLELSTAKLAENFPDNFTHTATYKESKESSKTKLIEKLSMEGKSRKRKLANDFDEIIREIDRYESVVSGPFGGTISRRAMDGDKLKSLVVAKKAKLTR